MFRRLLLCSYVSLFLSACPQGPEGLRATPDGNGPQVYIDWDAKPLAEIPFPNDLALRNDPSSPTGLRLNLSLDAPTKLERDARVLANTLSGFGIFMPISIRFSAALDLDNITTRHAPDLDSSDDAFFLINVDPDSPQFGMIQDLDIGHGRFPADVDDPDRYFPNDSRVSEPSILFDTVHEDSNGNGSLDWGEDTDNDGMLDLANVYPVDTDLSDSLAVRDNLLTWYERNTDTLILRPVVPLLEETTYAVVISERLTGVDGNPVRSPWEYVHHLRQTEALRPMESILPDLGLAMDDVAFAWTYTTGRVTGELVDLRRGMYGEGPFAGLETEYPAGIDEALVVHGIPGIDNVHALPMPNFYSLFRTLGLIPSESEPVISRGYNQGSHVVGGSFTTINLLNDKDDGGRDSTDEFWVLDAASSYVDSEPLRVVFSCVVPVEDDQHQQPFPVVVYGHGYGSSRIEFIENLSWVASQVGVAACSFDYPGHGPSISESDLADFVPVLTNSGMMPFLDHLLDARYVDLDNDGEPDSGNDQWTSDAFHTRDQVRQGALDSMALIRALRNCGTGTMKAAGGGPDMLSCDWDLNGVPDIGGPDVDYILAGASLGGIVTSVAMAVEPNAVASIPIVSGGGLFDIGTRSNIGGAVEALSGRLWTPMLLGIPDGDGLIIEQMVNSAFTKLRSYPIARLDSVPAGGRIEVTNLANGETRSGYIPGNGRIRLSFPADAMTGPEKRWLLGIPDSGPAEGVVYQADDNEAIGDPLRVTVYDDQDQVLLVTEKFEFDVVFQATTFAAGSRLIALSSGLGHIRSSSDHRRVVSSLSLATEPGDPIAYAPHIYERPYPELFDGPTRVLQINTVGDPIVMFNSAVAQARATGLLERHEIDERYGMTVDNWLISRRVVQGLEEYGPYTDIDGNPALFDPDDLDNGSDGTGVPSDAPLRTTIEHDTGIVAWRIPYASIRGSHSPGSIDPNKPFDLATFLSNQAAHFMWSRGSAISDDPCLEANTCSFLRDPSPSE